jgi:hypothetical protein
MVNKCLEYWWALNNNLPEPRFFFPTKLEPRIEDSSCTSVWEFRNDDGEWVESNAYVIKFQINNPSTWLMSFSFFGSKVNFFIFGVDERRWNSLVHNRQEDSLIRGDCRERRGWWMMQRMKDNI